MAKRFTATEKWNDAWFVSLGPIQKLAWFYLCDTCDLAGVVDLSQPLAEFHLGGPFDWDGLIQASDGRIERLPCGKLHLTRFVAWQFGELNENNNAHRAVLKTIEKHRLDTRSCPGAAQPHKGPRPGAQDKDKDKDKDKDQTEGGVGETKPPHPKQPFDRFWESVPRKVAKAAAAKAYSAAVKAIRGRQNAPGGDDPHGYLLDRMTAFAASETASGAFCPHPATWLNQGRYDDDPADWRESRGSPPPRIHSGPGQVYQPGSVSDGF